MANLRKIKLHSGEYALVDKTDFNYLNKFKWYLDGGKYAYRTVGRFSNINEAISIRNQLIKEYYGEFGRLS